MFALALLQLERGYKQIATNIPVVWDMTPSRLLQFCNPCGVISQKTGVFDQPFTAKRHIFVSQGAGFSSRTTQHMQRSILTVRTALLGFFPLGVCVFVLLKFVVKN
jgi:hypothetical protein